MAIKLTPEQKASRKISRDKYRQKLRDKKNNNSDPVLSLPEKEIQLPYVPPIPETILPMPTYAPPMPHVLSLCLKVSLCISITCLLCYFQAVAYAPKESLEPLHWAIAIVCEISLCYLSASLNISWASRFLFAALFTYNIGVMTYAIKRDETIKTIKEIKGDTDEKMRQELFAKTMIAFDLSAKRHETGNTARFIKILEDTTKSPVAPMAKPMLNVLKFESISLIVLRAILMLLNALLIHRILLLRKIK
jgi:hypothetical protein